MKKKLKGITWNHTRGLVSVQAVSQRFSELNPSVEIVWEKRSLQEFADAHIGKLIEQYDLLVIDHPWSGYANEHGVLKNLYQLLPQEYLLNQAKNSVGRSFESYNFDGFLCALPIDAATPIATYRSDLISQVPTTYQEVLELASSGKVIIPAIEIDSLMNFLMFYNSLGGVIDELSETAFDKDASAKALQALKQLSDLCPDDIFEMNPIAVYERLSNSNNFHYCPFAYGYANYSTPGYSEHVLDTAPLVSFQDNILRSTLGGTGLAISAASQYPDEASAFVRFACSPEIQSSLYAFAGGQPGHRSAWTDGKLNRHSNYFYLNTLKDLDQSYLRPRFSGYLDFQDHAGLPVQQYLKGEIDITNCVDSVNKLFAESRKGV